MEDINWKMLVAPLIILFLFIGGIIGVINWQKSRQEAPTPGSTLSVNLPEGESQATEKELTVTGKVDKGSDVFVNEEEVKVERDGSFTKVITLNDGYNKFVIKEKKDGQEISVVERNVKYAPVTTQTPAPQATPEQAAPAPAAQAPQAGVAPQPQDLATSGPEDFIPVIGAGGIVVAVVYYLKTRKRLSLSLRK